MLVPEDSIYTAPLALSHRITQRLGVALSLDMAPIHWWTLSPEMSLWLPLNYQVDMGASQHRTLELG